MRLVKIIWRPDFGFATHWPEALLLTFRVCCLYSAGRIFPREQERIGSVGVSVGAADVDVSSDVLLSRQNLNTEAAARVFSR